MKKLNTFTKNDSAVSTAFELLLAIGIVISIILLFLFAAGTFYDVYEREDIDLTAKAIDILSVLASSPGLNQQYLSDWIQQPEVAIQIGLAQTEMIDYGYLDSDGMIHSIKGINTNLYSFPTNESYFFTQDANTYIRYTASGTNHLYQLLSTSTLSENTLDYEKIKALDTFISTETGYQYLKDIMGLKSTDISYDFCITLTNSTTTIMNSSGGQILNDTFDHVVLSREILIQHPPSMTAGQTTITPPWTESGIITLTTYYGIP